jgi:hypothetical protein
LLGEIELMDKRQRLRRHAYLLRRALGYFTVIVFFPTLLLMVAMFIYSGLRTQVWTPAVIVIAGATVATLFVVPTIRDFFDPTRCGLPPKNK